MRESGWGDENVSSLLKWGFYKIHTHRFVCPIQDMFIHSLWIAFFHSLSTLFHLFYFSRINFSCFTAALLCFLCDFFFFFYNFRLSFSRLGNCIKSTIQTHKEWTRALYTFVSVSVLVAYRMCQVIVKIIILFTQFNVPCEIRTSLLRDLEKKSQSMTILVSTNWQFLLQHIFFN